MRNTTALFPSLLLVSLLVHAFIYTRLADLYSTEGTSVIDLSIEETASKPESRQIPRPRFRPNLPPLPKEIVRQSAKAQPIEDLKVPAMEPVEAPLPDSLKTKIDIPEAAPTPTLSPADIAPSPSAAAGSGYGSERDYFDMVRLKIESSKKYPRQAKAMRREGRVGVAFVIEPDGMIHDLVVKTSSGSSQLDHAALLAVRKSSPLPAPPRHLFAGARRVELTVAFELL